MKKTTKKLRTLADPDEAGGGREQDGGSGGRNRSAPSTTHIEL